jgi:glutamate 5-kinase
LIDILSQKEIAHTWFEPAQKPASGVKKWIAYSDGFTKGSVVVNKGAAAALKSEKAVSLLPVGIVSIENEFKKGDLIRIVDELGNTIGLGKAQFNSDKVEARKTVGKTKSAGTLRLFVHGKQQVKCMLATPC